MRSAHGQTDRPAGVEFSTGPAEVGAPRASHYSMLTYAVPVDIPTRMDAVSTCPQRFGQGGFCYRRQNGALGFNVCTVCRGHRFIDDGEPLSPPQPSQLPPWRSPQRSDQCPIAGRWLTAGGCLDFWPSGRMSLVREWGYALGLTGRGVALWNDGAIGVLRGMPLGGRGYILKFSNANLLTGFCAIRRGPHLPLFFRRAQSDQTDASHADERRRPARPISRHSENDAATAGSGERRDGVRREAPSSN